MFPDGSSTAVGAMTFLTTFTLRQTRDQRWIPLNSQKRSRSRPGMSPRPQHRRLHFFVSIIIIIIIAVLVAIAPDITVLADWA